MEPKAVLALFGALILFSVKSDAANCPDGWTGYHTSCYFVITDLHSWYNAKITCETLGGHLVEIEDQLENHFVAVNLLQGHYAWIGLEDFLFEGDFMWATTGQRPYYTPWAPGDPDDYGGHEDCVVINWDGDTWNDATCESLMQAVCERQELQTPVGK